MKYFLIITFFFCLRLNAQVLNPSTYDLWKTWDSKYAQEKSSWLVDNYTEQYGQLDIKDYYFVDADNDGTDEVFLNYRVGEGFGIVVLKSIGEQMISSNIVGGEIIQVERSSISGLLTITLHQYPCCADFTHILRTAAIKITPGQISLITLKEDAYVEGTVEPSHRISRVAFRTMNPEYTLRTSPIIDDEPDEYDLLIKGNVIAIYPPGSRGYALGKETDETGREWWFVIMENNIEPIQSVIYSKNFKTRTMGWMSSRYLEKIN